MSAAESQFAALVADPARHAVADFSPESDVMLVLFGGIAGGVSMPVYEFFRVTAGYPAKRLFLRDPRRSWYLRGLPGVGDDAAALEGALAETIRQSGCSRVVMAGASAGGFAALRFGARLRADHVLAFSPQTFIDLARRAEFGDERWPDQIAALHEEFGGDVAEYDAAAAVAAAQGTRFGVHVSTDDDLDLVHAQRLAGLPGVSIHEHAGGGHRLVKWLRDAGKLAPLLADALGPGALGR